MFTNHQLHQASQSTHVLFCSLMLLTKAQLCNDLLLFTTLRECKSPQCTHPIPAISVNKTRHTNSHHPLSLPSLSQSPSCWRNGFCVNKMQVCLVRINNFFYFYLFYQATAPSNYKDRTLNLYILYLDLSNFQAMTEAEY